jgi:putative Mn2+ efflux pump MntP
MNIGTFILALVQPIIARIFVALGFSLVSFVGMDLLMDGLSQQVQGAWGGLPSNLIGLAGLAGIGEALSIVLGAIATRVMIWQLARSTRIIMSNPQ